ncbi:ribosome small subunit-dependent GTPase A [Granulosicoccus antarcticus]|uniref:Small ribosomal subunit biogenesis GTPase RsgA n=1 Tax=Granulosicoccus antarcticus IMCC3135 TaxID=1192854 RepID=A0A2Z2NVC9_9GAMM|nr:ribosome small subunit-dependent GTPase A [Granulosicoccus antarcticus]ASJ74465.1 Putative ribosome biogenesis GTPase RsgA [Granulosicoccus antarcticus IMCC3135]
MQARIIANFRASVAVQIEGQSAIRQAYPLRSVPLLVAGDKVLCEEDGDVLRVHELVPRSSVLERSDRRTFKPLAANLTHLGIVSANPPGIDTLLIDQFCLAAHRAGVGALIILNKADLLSEEERESCDRMLEVYRSIGYPAVAIDTKNADGIDPLLNELEGRAFTLVGASGVGKSSIIQKLLPDKELRVGAVSAATGIGSHTTSVTFWYDLPGGAAIIDSPGVRQYSVAHLAPNIVREGYHELARAAESCRFGDCSHTVEPGCGVLHALAENTVAQWRYDNYCKLAGI